jgi:hypothetical protein
LFCKIESKKKGWQLSLVSKITKGLIVEKMAWECFFTSLNETPVPQVFSVIKTKN